MQTVTFKAPPQLIGKLSRMAADRDRSLSYMLRQAVEDYIQEMEEDEADARIALERLRNPQGPFVTLEELEKKHGLARTVRRPR
jgi:predicted transcriptional regulator